MNQHILVSDDGGIRTIRMNRPEKKNALTLAMYDAMSDALESSSADANVRCVLFAGVPGAFSAGNDLADFLAASQGAGSWSAQALRFVPGLVHCRKPLIAAVSGAAVGIGTTCCSIATTWRLAPCAILDSVRRARPGSGSRFNAAGAAHDGPASRVRVAGDGPRV